MLLTVILVVCALVIIFGLGCFAYIWFLAQMMKD